MSAGGSAGGVDLKQEENEQAPQIAQLKVTTRPYVAGLSDQAAQMP